MDIDGVFDQVSHKSFLMANVLRGNIELYVEWFERVEARGLCDEYPLVLYSRQER